MGKTKEWLKDAASHFADFWTKYNDGFHMYFGIRILKNCRLGEEFIFMHFFKNTNRNADRL